VAASVKMPPWHIVRFVEHFGTGNATPWINQINTQGMDNGQVKGQVWPEINTQGMDNGKVKGQWWPEINTQGMDNGKGKGQWWPESNTQGMDNGKGKGQWWFDINTQGMDNGMGKGHWWPEINTQGMDHGKGKGKWWPEKGAWWPEGYFKGSGKGKGKRWPEKTAGSKYDPKADFKGKPGPNGEPPATGRWSFESNGAGCRKKWKWKIDLLPEEREYRRAKRAYEEEEEASRDPRRFLSPQFLE